MTKPIEPDFVKGRVDDLKDINGQWWGGETANFDRAFAYVDGGNQDIKHTNVAEAYRRLALHSGSRFPRSFSTC